MTWGWRHYRIAIAETQPDDCASIPKVPGAGQIFNDVMEAGKPVPPHQLMHNGVKVGLDGYYANMFTEIIRVLKGHHEPQEERVFHEVLQTLPEEICMIEAGGYWAYYSMLAKKAKRSVRNIIIEPVDGHIALGKSNFALNDMNGEFLRAYIGESSLGPHAANLEGLQIPDLERVCIDDVMERYQIPFAHIIHSDVQGAELDLLRGSKKTIEQSRVGYFFLSTHGDSLHLECRQYLVDRGFVIIAEHTRKESFSADGLIVARAKDFPGLDSVPISHNARRTSPLVVPMYVLRSLGLLKKR